MHAKLYDFTLAAPGDTQEIAAVGSYIKVNAALGPVRLRSDSGHSIEVLPGQGWKEFPFQRVWVTNLYTLPNKGTIAIGDETMVDDRTTGDVNVVDGGKLRTLANLSFGTQAVRAALAANLCAIALQNPAAPTGQRRVIVERVTLVPTVSTIVYGKSIMSAFGGWTVGGSGVSKYPRLSGNAGTPTQAVSNDLPGGISAPEVLTFAPANQATVLAPGVSPWVLEPGSGLVMFTGTTNVGMWTCFEWYEEPL